MNFIEFIEFLLITILHHWVLSSAAPPCPKSFGWWSCASGPGSQPSDPAQMAHKNRATGIAKILRREADNRGVSWHSVLRWSSCRATNGLDWSPARPQKNAALVSLDVTCVLNKSGKKDSPVLRCFVWVVHGSNIQRKRSHAGISKAWPTWHKNLPKD